MSTTLVEDVEAFRRRAREFVRSNLRPVAPGARAGLLRNDRTDDEELEEVAHDRRLQRQLYDAGLAGVCVPVEYGGQGLTPAHQHALNEELSGFEYPQRFQSPTFAPCLAVLLDFGTEEQKRTHIPAMLRGDELWMQFLSEPSGGSDVAGALTTAVRDGDEWILNGSKVWTTGAWWSDWGLCLARTDWDVPKHRGLSVFMFPIHQPGIEIHRIALLNGFKDFCQEFLTDLRVPDSDRLGEVNDGWTVGTRWMFHERMLHHSPLVTMPPGDAHGGGGADAVLRAAQESGHLDEADVADRVGEAYVLEWAGEALQDRIAAGMANGTMSDQAAAIRRLFDGIATARTTTLRFEVSGADAVAWTDDDGPLVEIGTGYLMRQISCIGGGTTEMARNVVSERVLGMPREASGDRGIPFRDVPRGPS